MTNLNEWLSLNRIGYIISIDDLHNPKLTTLEESTVIRTGLRVDFEEYSKLFLCIEGLRENISIYKENIDELMNIYDRMMESRENPEFIESVKKIMEEKKSAINLIKDLVEQLKEIKEDKNNPIKDYITYESYEDAIENYEKYLLKINNRDYKVLWLVDFELEGKNSNKNGIELIKDILKKREQDSNFIKNNIFTILSSFTNEDHNLENLYRKIYSIEKKSLTNKMELANNIIIGSKAYISSVLIGDIVKRLTTGLENAKQRLLKESLGILDYLIVSYPTIEGTHPIELLLRIFGVTSKSEFEDSISKDITQVFELLNEYELMYNKDELEDPKSDFINECYKKEKYNNNINLFHNSITSGDIFFIEGQHYILISQPCDLAIRGDEGTRTSKYGVLLRLSEEKIDSVFRYPLNYFKDKPYNIDFKKQIYIDIDILDLCTLNQDGYSKIPLKAIEDTRYKEILENQSDENLQITEYFRGLLEEKLIEGYYNKPNQKQLFNVILKVNKAFKNISELRNLISEENHCKIEQLIKANNGIIGFNNFSIEEGFLKYNIRRVTNLNSVVTSDIITKVSNYSSRIGKPGAFANGIEKESFEYKIFIEDINSGEENLIAKLILPNDPKIIRNKVKEMFKEIINGGAIDRLKINGDQIKITSDIQVVKINDHPFAVKKQKDETQICLSIEKLKEVDGGKELIETLEQITAGIENKTIENSKEYLQYYDPDTGNIRPNIKMPLSTNVTIINNEILITSNFNDSKIMNEGRIEIT